MQPQIAQWFDQDQRGDYFQVHGTTVFAGSGPANPVIVREGIQEGEGQIDHLAWTPLGRFTGESLDEAIDSYLCTRALPFQMLHTWSSSAGWP